MQPEATAASVAVARAPTRLTVPMSSAVWKIAKPASVRWSRQASDGGGAAGTGRIVDPKQP